MRSRILAAAALAVVISAPLMASSAQASTCGTLTVTATSLTSAGCSVGPVTFSNIVVNMTFLNGGSGALTSLDTVTFVGPGGDTEYGLALSYAAIASGVNSTVDIAWTYNVAATYLTDAYLSLTGSTQGTGKAGVDETITAPGISPAGFIILSLATPGVATDTFPPVLAAFVQKDEYTFSGSDGFATTSVLTNAFSVGQTPLPAAVWMFGSVLAGAGSVAGWRRKRKAA